jgi:uncharacterized protein (DUF1800 family)
MGRTAWLDEQLSPPDGDDEAMKQILEKATYPIEYGENKSEDSKWPAVDEDRPLRTLNQPLEEIWHLRDYNKKMAFQERVRPRDEVTAATWLRARYSKYQLREVLTAFWHDHFHVNAHTDDISVAVAWPTYDRMMRKHALGNFRVLLEEMTKSQAMLIYLNNRSNRASPANENFARELFELHTMGKGAYLNHLYNRWREVPGATKGKPVGYIDQDVYEAARAFTGWTLADAGWGVDGAKPNTGEFMYLAGMHDPYQKRVLGVEIDANGPPMADGLKVLDLVAGHPATAKHVCRKLVRRLVSDDPPESLVEKAAKVFRENATAADQIAKVVRAIASSSEFAQTFGKKTKKPFEFIVSLARATNGELHADPGLNWISGVMGQRMFGWPTPDGAPDVGSAWLSANGMIGRWNVCFWLTSKDSKATKMDFLRETPESVKTIGDACDYWAERFLPGIANETNRAALREAVTQWAPTDTVLSRPQGLDALIGIAALAAMAPEFHLR